jgi:hypothetical protein
VRAAVVGTCDGNKKPFQQALLLNKGKQYEAEKKIYKTKTAQPLRGLCRLLSF